MTADDKPEIRDSRNGNGDLVYDGNERDDASHASMGDEGDGSACRHAILSQEWLIRAGGCYDASRPDDVSQVLAR